jgi:hypothetical protein
MGVMAGAGAAVIAVPVLVVATSEGLVATLLIRGSTTLLTSSSTAATTAAITNWVRNPTNQQLLAEGGAFVAGIIDPNPNAQYSAGPGDELGNFVGGVFRTSARGVDYFFRSSRSADEMAIGTADLVNGALNLDLNIPENLKKSGIGSQMFSDALMFFGDKVKSIAGVWADGDNLKAFNDALKAGLSKSDAIFSTPTGKWAKSNGFTNYKVTQEYQSKETQDYLKINILFTKPND